MNEEIEQVDVGNGDIKKIGLKIYQIIEQKPECAEQMKNNRYKQDYKGQWETNT